MEKETLIQELKNRVGETDFGDRTFSEVADSLMPLFSKDENVSDELWGVATTMIKSAMGQYRYDKKQWIEKKTLELENKMKSDYEAAIEKFKSEYKPHNEVESKEDTSKKDLTTAVTEAIKEYHKSLYGEDGKGGDIGSKLSQISSFMEVFMKREESMKINEIKKELVEYLTEKGATKEPVINLSVKELGISSNADIDTLKIKLEKMYEEKYKEFYGEGANPFGGNSAGGEDNDNVDYDVKRYLDQRKKSEELKAQKVQSVKSSLI